MKIKKLLYLGFLVCLASGLLGCDFFVDNQTRLDRANNYWQKGDYRSAIIELKKILEKDSNHAHAWLTLGEISLFLGKAADAEKEFRRAADAGASPEAYWPRLAEALLLSGKYQVLLDELPIEGQSELLQRQMKILHGKAYLGLNNLEKSHAVFLSILQARPDAIEAMLGLARIGQLKSDNNAANMYIDTALKVDQNYIPARLFKGELAFLKKDYAVAEKIFSDVLEKQDKLNPSEYFTALSAKAESQMRQGRTVEIKKTVEILLQQFPSHPRSLYLAGSLAYADGQFEKAREYLQQVLTGVPRYLPAQILMGAVNYQLGNLEQADSLFSEILSGNPENTQVRKMLAATRIRREQPDDAVSLLEPLAAESGNDGETLSLVGRARLQAGETEEGLMLLEQGARLDPGNQALQMDLASAYLSAGDFDHAIDTLKNLGSEAGDSYRRNLLLVYAYSRSQNWQEAMKICEQMIAEMPKDVRPYLLAGGVLAAKGDVEQATERYQKVLNLDPANTTAKMNLGRLALKARNPVAARGYFEKVLTDKKEDLGAMIAMAQSFDLENKTDDAIVWLKKSVESGAGSEQPGMILIRYMLQKRRYEDARQEASALLKKNPRDIFAVNSMAAALVGQEKPQEAEKVIAEALARSPEAAVLHYNLGRIHMSVGAVDKARIAFEKTLSLQPQNLSALESLVMLEMKAGNTARAHKLLEDFKQKNGQQERLSLLEGDALVYEQRYAEAAKIYRRILDNSPDNRGVTLRLFSALQKTDPPTAEALLHSWVEKYPQDGQARFLLAQHYQTGGATVKAIAGYEKMLELQSDNAVVLNNLAWLYHEQGDERALQMAERASVLLPDNPSVQDTYAWILLNKGQLEKGMSIIKPIAERIPEALDIQYHFAYGLHKQGNNAKAREILDKILKSGSGFAHAKDAAQLYKQIQ